MTTPAPETACAADGGNTVNEGNVSVPAEEHQALLRKLQRSDELIKQLKHIVKAQHAKIEEFREKVEMGNVRSSLLDYYEVDDFQKVKLENEEFRRSVSRLQAEMGKVKNDNNTLRKANRRLKSMLEQLGDGLWSNEDLSSSLVEPQPSFLPDMTASTMMQSLSPKSSSRNPFIRTVSTSLPLSARGPARLHESRESGPAAGPSSDSDVVATEPSSPSRKRNGKGDGPVALAGLPPFSRVSRLIAAVGTFWREQESPVSALRVMTDVAGRLLADRPGCHVTVYVIDRWLRQAVTKEQQAKTLEQPAIFYLGQGKTELQVMRRSDNVPQKAVAPRFSDLQALPYRSRNAVAVAVKHPNQSRTWAVLQVVIDDATGETNAPPPKVIKEVLKDEQLNDRTSASFLDVHVNYLQLLCGMVGGILLNIQQLQQRTVIVERNRSCIDSAVLVNKAKSIADFEQRVKHLLGSFFKVNTIRVLFYDPETDSLLLSSSQMRKKGCMAIPITKGIVGQCAQKRQMMFVNDLASNPWVDAVADGLQTTRQSAAGHSGMLVGPMLVDETEPSSPVSSQARANVASESTEGSALFGVVQLLEQKKGRANTDGSAGGFQHEELVLFQQLLRVCAYAGSRTLKVQQLSAQLAGQTWSMQRLLSG